MADNILVQVFWVACVATAIVASLLANWSRRAQYIARVATGVLMLFGGALFNAANLLVSREDYVAFADQAHFWVTAAWRQVVAPNVFLFISLLVIFEAAVGVLILSGGRRTQLGLIGAIGFHLALWLFGWGVTTYDPDHGPGAHLVTPCRAARRRLSRLTHGRRSGNGCRRRSGKQKSSVALSRFDILGRSVLAPSSRCS